MSPLRRYMRTLSILLFIALLCIFAKHLHGPQNIEKTKWESFLKIRSDESRLSVSEEKLPAILLQAEKYFTTSKPLSTKQISKTDKNKAKQKKPSPKTSTIIASAATKAILTKTTSKSPPIRNKVTDIKTKSITIGSTAYAPKSQTKKSKVTVEPKGWSYKGPKNLRCAVQTLGCFLPASENDVKSLSVLVDSSPQMTNWYCIELCSKRATGRVVFAGVRNGKECRCVFTVTFLIQLEQSEDCNEPCSGDSSLYCGGRNDVTMLYRVFSKCTIAPETSTVLTESSILGCHAKPTDLSSIMEESFTQRGWSDSECLLHCERKGLVLAVPFNSTLCYCGLTTESFNLENPVDISLCAKNTGEHIMVYRTLAEDMRCSRKRFLKKGELKNKVGLITFPGSGNTWLRHLIETTTGIFTGSVYQDPSMVQGGYLGELLSNSSDKIAVVKSHQQGHINTNKLLTSIINVYRNPYDAILSEFNRRSAKGHTKAVDSEHFNKEAFANLSGNSYAKKWRYTTELAIASNLPKMIFSYDDLVKDPVLHSERMARFIMGDLLDEGELQERLLCLRLVTKGGFKRKKEPLNFDPYTKLAKLNLNSQIESLARTLQKHGYQQMPDYRRQESG